ncbi:MAG TPA: type II toxin-antitoxin system RelE/ParE family toxin [Pseudolabrys sp.]|nr:type II toxin-antitoxin system RelE/ParE family toxin [Pseudolabrys sp.]
MKVEWSAAAIADLDRFAQFLQDRLPNMARMVGHEITQKSDLLIEHPELGRSLARRPDLRQLVLRVLNASYVIQYRVMPDRLIILRVFHGREARDR